MTFEIFEFLKKINYKKQSFPHSRGFGVLGFWGFGVSNGVLISLT